MIRSSLYRKAATADIVVQRIQVGSGDLRFKPENMTAVQTERETTT